MSIDSKLNVNDEPYFKALVQAQGKAQYYEPIMVPIVDKHDVDTWAKDPTLGLPTHHKSLKYVFDVVSRMHVSIHKHNNTFKHVHCAVSAHPMAQGEGVAVGGFTTSRTGNIILSDPDLWNIEEMAKLSEHDKVFQRIQKILPSWRSDILERAILLANHLMDGTMTAKAQDVSQLAQGQGFAVYDFYAGGYLRVTDSAFSRGICEPLFNASIFPTREQAQLATSKFGHLGRQYALVPVDLRIEPHRYELIQSSGMAPMPLTQSERDMFEHVQAQASALQLNDEVQQQGMDNPKKKM